MTLYHHPVVVVSYIVGRGGRGLMELGGGKIFFFRPGLTWCEQSARGTL